MNYKIKALVQNILSNIPFGERINYYLQKNLSHSLPINEIAFRLKVEEALFHIQSYKKFSSNREIRYFEFGAGWDMIVPLVLRLEGCNELTCIDIRRLIFPELIENSIERLSKNFDQYSSILNSFDTKQLYNDPETFLKDKFNINYIAPSDARKTNIESNSIDLISSTATFEHIPKKIISEILKESQRILSSDGILSCTIDYKDHYSYFDRSISIYNFLQFEDKTWNYLNPSLHYQNRLRHIDYLQIFEDAGFKLLFEELVYPDDNEKAILEKIVLADTFKNYSLDSIAIKSSRLVFRKIK
ncbi:MAG: class I SAM-dependent methyltransferase [Leptospiraceae bacterium]|nr:class I SAM-dependent methyltransferase [Leptospiraceae bacterium]